jgi:hypothetical protein
MATTISMRVELTYDELLYPDSDKFYTETLLKKSLHVVDFDGPGKLGAMLGRVEVEEITL